jgi:hypothetical protein
MEAIIKSGGWGRGGFGHAGGGGVPELLRNSRGAQSGLNHSLPRFPEAIGRKLGGTPELLEASAASAFPAPPFSVSLEEAKVCRAKPQSIWQGFDHTRGITHLVPSPPPPLPTHTHTYNTSHPGPSCP